MIDTKDTNITKLSSSAATVLANIARFQHEVDKSAELQDRLAYARAWYANRDKKGNWQFGPSKFVGYEGLDAANYIAVAQDIDGRRTEAQLHQWFLVVDPSSALHQELSGALFAFLGHYGKAPSTKMRISVLHDVHREHFDGELPDASAAIIDLIVAVANTLPPHHLATLRARLAA